MSMMRQPGFRILPMVLAAMVALAVVGGLVHLLCEDEEAGFGEPAATAASVGLGLCILSVAFLASKVRSALRTLLSVLAVPREPLRTLEVARPRRFYGLPPPSPPTLPLLQVWRT
jgi:Na+/H+ antiporter NhaA